MAKLIFERRRPMLVKQSAMSRLIKVYKKRLKQENRYPSDQFDPMDSLDARNRRALVDNTF